MIIFNSGIQGDCDTVEDYQELDAALRRLIKDFSGRINIHRATLSCTVDEDLQAAAEVQSMKTRSKDVRVISNPQ